jgi:hypothetical protein
VIIKNTRACPTKPEAILASNSSLIIPYCFEYNDAKNNIAELRMITKKLKIPGTTGAER